MVVGCRHVGRIVFKLVSPGVAHIHVNGIAVAVEFPHAGYGNRGPAAVVEILAEKVVGTAVGILYPEKFPGAVEAQVIFGIAQVAVGKRILAIFIGERHGPHRQAVNGIYIGIVPFGKRLSRQRKRASRQQRCEDGRFHWL